MFEKFTSVDAGNFKQRYLNTFGYFTYRKDGVLKRTLVKLTTINHEDRIPYVEFKDKDDAVYKVMADASGDETGFTFLPPKSAWYNTSTGIPYLVSRIPARQFLRGICDKNTAIQTVRLAQVGVNFTSMHMLFEESVSVPEALRLCRNSTDTSQSSGVAISPQFMYHKAGMVLKCFNQTIGNCIDRDDHFEVKLLKPEMWQTEVRDAFKRAGIEVKVS